MTNKQTRTNNQQPTINTSTWAVARGTVAMAFRFGLRGAASNNTLKTMHRQMARINFPDRPIGQPGKFMNCNFPILSPNARAHSGDASTCAIARGTVAMAVRFGLGGATQQPTNQPINQPTNQITKNNKQKLTNRHLANIASWLVEFKHKYVDGNATFHDRPLTDL